MRRRRTGWGPPIAAERAARRSPPAPDRWCGRRRLRAQRSCACECGGGSRRHTGSAAGADWRSQARSGAWSPEASGATVFVSGIVGGWSLRGHASGACLAVATTAGGAWRSEASGTAGFASIMAGAAVGACTGSAASAGGSSGACGADAAGDGCGDTVGVAAAAATASTCDGATLAGANGAGAATSACLVADGAFVSVGGTGIGAGSFAAASPADARARACSGDARVVVAAAVSRRIWPDGGDAVPPDTSGCADISGAITAAAP